MIRIVFLLLISITLAQGQKKPSEFPNALALLEYIHGVNRDKIPEFIKSRIKIDNYREVNSLKLGDEYFSKEGDHYIIFKDGIGENARIQNQNELRIILKSEEVFKRKNIDLESFVFFKIHLIEPDSSLKILESLNIDTDIVSDGIRLGRTMWVIGSNAREANVPQLWIDKKQLTVRKIHYLNLAQEYVQQIEWDDFEILGDFYFPKSSEIRQDPNILIHKLRIDTEILTKIPEDVIKRYKD